jgi:hypothetical protein
VGFENKPRKTFYVDCGAETKDLIWEYRKGCIRGCDEFKYSGVKIDKEDRQENVIKKRINKGRSKTALLNSTVEQKDNYKKQMTNI